MVTLNRPVSGDLILATDVTNIVAGVLGDDGYGQLWRFHAVTDTDDYGAILGNQDTTNGLAARIQYGTLASPTVLADFKKSAIVLNIATSLKQVSTPSDPGATYTAVYPKSDSNLYYFPTGGSETRIGTYAQTVTSILTTQGDLPYASAANTVTRLAKGTAYQELTMNSGATAPQWSSGVLATVSAAGDLVYASGANAISRLAKGTALQVLGMNSGATAPEWQASPQSVLTTTGDLLYASAANTLARLGIGTARQALTVNSGANGFAYVASLQSLMTAQGDIVQASAANTPARLAIGTARQTLAVNSGATALEYVASLQSLMTGTGDLVYSSSANTPARLAAGTNGHILTLSDGVPTWAAPTAVSLQSGSAVGSTADPTTSSASYADLAEMSVTLTTTGGVLLVWFSGTFYHDTAGTPLTVALSLDGASEVAIRESMSYTPGGQFELSICHRFSGVSSASHTVKARWKTAGGTATAYTTMRNILVQECPA